MNHRGTCAIRSLTCSQPQTSTQGMRLLCQPWIRLTMKTDTPRARALLRKAEFECGRAKHTHTCLGRWCGCRPGIRRGNGRPRECTHSVLAGIPQNSALLAPYFQTGSIPQDQNGEEMHDQSAIPTPPPQGSQPPSTSQRRRSSSELLKASTGRFHLNPSKSSTQYPILSTQSALSHAQKHT